MSRPMRPRAPWYADGVRFECQPDCGDCCTAHGDHVYVYLDGEDLPGLAAFLGLSPLAFEREYTTLDDGWTVLRMDDPACPFLDGTRCTVYPARPTQCRTFPFWSENLDSPEAWQRVASFCPGVGRGQRHPLSVIRQHLAERES